MRSKKGFTLVELLIVIAILAILATVAIVGYTSFIDKANQSVDEQAVTQINTALEAFEITDEKPGDLTQLIQKLNDMDLDLGDYKPLKSGMQFYWVKSENRIIYVDDAKNVAYPEKYVDLQYVPGNWFVLDGSIKKENIDYNTAVDANGSLNIANAGQFAQFVEDFSNNTNGIKDTVNKIVLTDDIYLDGGEVFFNQDKASWEIDGQGHTIYGLRVATNSKLTVEGEGGTGGRKQEFGFIASVGRNQTVTIKNVTFDGVSVGDPDMSVGGTKYGLIAGNVSGTLNLENVKFTNSSVTGFQKVGAVAGMASPGSTVNLTDVIFENVNVAGKHETQAIVGVLYTDNNGDTAKDAKLNAANTTNDGITVKIIK